MGLPFPTSLPQSPDRGPNAISSKRSHGSLEERLVSDMAGSVQRSRDILCQRPKKRNIQMDGVLSKALGSQYKRPVTGVTWTNVPSKP